MPDYLLTIKRNALEYTPAEDLVQVLDHLKLNLKGAEWDDFYSIELDKHSRLHLHIVFTIRKAPYFTKLQRRGFNVHFKAIDSMYKAKKYVRKLSNCDASNDQAEWDSYYHWHQMAPGEAHN